MHIVDFSNSLDSGRSNYRAQLQPKPEGDRFKVSLRKDKKIISRVACVDPPWEMPGVWNVTSIVRQNKLEFLSALPHFLLCPAAEDPHQENEWSSFLDFLKQHKRVAILELGYCEVYILPSSKDPKMHLATACYKGITGHALPRKKSYKEKMGEAELLSPNRPLVGETAMSNSNMVEETSPEQTKPANSIGHNRGCDRNFATAHPSYLETLGQAHSGWIFGAIAELVDNARDAKATKLEVAITLVYSIYAGSDIPMLGVIDDGHGMSHSDIHRMVQIGRARPEGHNVDRIGRYGVGFKTGAMRLGKDALVLTQTATSRSIAFLSQSLNEGKDKVEIPIVSYRRIGQYMEVDTDVQSVESAKYNLKVIKKFSPFDKYLIGEKAGLFNGSRTGTQIYIWNLDKWGSSYSLQWENGMTGGSSFHQGGIAVRSKRIRSRTGQISRKVPLDYCLKSYLEVIFFNPRMKIYVQGALVKSRPLAKSLSKTVVENGSILGKRVQLILGRSQLEWEQANCGIFLYWHGRLIEAYKRVGSMVYNGDSGRGILGVIDVTELMDESDGHTWVHNNKQGFQDCEAYAELEKWLGEKANAYLDTYVDNIEVEKGDDTHKPDYDWAQCDKCRKWRKFDADFDINTLPLEWFCYMKPFSGKCEIPEEKVKSGVITICTKRNRGSTKDPESSPSESEGTSDDANIRHKVNGLRRGGASTTPIGPKAKVKLETGDVVPLSNKRQRILPSRTCKKG